MFVYQESWSLMVTRALIGIDGISGEIKYDPGLSEVAVLNGDCGDRDDRKLELEMWVIVV